LPGYSARSSSRKRTWLMSTSSMICVSAFKSINVYNRILSMTKCWSSGPCDSSTPTNTSAKPSCSSPIWTSKRCQPSSNKPDSS
jgi:hypothetical protein